MLYELRSYLIAPGRLADYVDAVRDVGRPVRGDRYGKLEGHWCSQSEPFDRIVTLWTYTDFAERERLRVLLDKDERWKKDFLPLLRGIVLVQDNQLMEAVGAIRAPQGRHVLELCTERTIPGKSSAWLHEFLEVLPIREHYGTKVGIWRTTIGRLHQVVHMWAYDTPNSIADARDGLMQDERWQRFVASTTPFLAESSTQLLRSSMVLP
jgi:hypothetical protein